MFKHSLNSFSKRQRSPNSTDWSDDTQQRVKQASQGADAPSLRVMAANYLFCCLNERKWCISVEKTQGRWTLGSREYITRWLKLCKHSHRGHKQFVWSPREKRGSQRQFHQKYVTVCLSLSVNSVDCWELATAACPLTVNGMIFWNKG